MKVSSLNFYKDVLRVLLIFYHFSTDCTVSNNPELIRVFKGEVKIQKIDFLIRYPSYFCYELIMLSKSDSKINKDEIKIIIRDIFNLNEPELRTEEMLKFFYGAYEKLDEIISYLLAYGFIEFVSERGIDNRTIQKAYYLTKFGVNKIENNLKSIDCLDWYFNRCQLIKRYFGSLSGSDLKAMQYEIEEYKEAIFGEYIRDIESKTKDLFFNEFSEIL